jgi:hypothetical protein
MGQVTVDFIARDQGEGTWRMVLVEQGPWAPQTVTSELRRVQARLYTCLDAALAGDLAAKFPDSRGKQLIIQLDGYALPDHRVREFFDRFATEVLRLPDYKAAFARQAFVSDVVFQLNLQPLDA